MVALLDELRAFMIMSGFKDVFLLQYPDSPDDIISLYERENPLAFGTHGIDYGARVAQIQIRVRRFAPDAAEQDAWRLFSLLNSGPDEELIQLSPGLSVTSRPSPPFHLEYDTKNRCTFVVKAVVHTPTERRS